MRGHHLVALPVALLVGSAPTPVQAALGDTVESIELDAARLGQAHRALVASASTSVRTHLITSSDGSTVKEFVGPDDRVFAVSWNTRFKPRLDTLLGQYASTYASAASQASRSPGIRHSVAFVQGDLVIEASAHLNAHAGRAYLRSLVPADARVDDIR